MTMTTITTATIMAVAGSSSVRTLTIFYRNNKVILWQQFQSACELCPWGKIVIEIHETLHHAVVHFVVVVFAVVVVLNMRSVVVVVVATVPMK